MSDKNPYYSIPKALGEPREEINMLPTCSDMSALIELRERMERQIRETFGFPVSRPRALAYRGGQFVSLPIDDAGNVIEQPLRCPDCGPILWCPKHSPY